jgi:hypothetical protein
MDEAQMMQIAVLVKEMLEPRFQGIERSIVDVRTSIADMDIRMETRFQAVEGSIADMHIRMETRFQAVEGSIAVLQTDVANTNAGLPKSDEDNVNAFVIGICSSVWPFRRFWVPLCPKSWTKAD